MTVIETPFFLRKAATLLDEEERSELVAFPLLVKTCAQGRKR